MNQPASKEPTMDEILSSIRQIIADDDEAATQKMPAPKPAGLKPVASQPEPAPAPTPAPADIDPFSDDEDDVVPPLALSPEQIVDEAPVPEPEVNEPEPAIVEDLDATSGLVMPDDVAFEQDKDEEPQPEPAMKAEPAPAPRAEPKPEPAPKPASFAQAAPMPDPDLSSDLAEQLLEPATSAAVRSAFSKLGTPKITPETPLGAGGLTIESMIREMLRPMLKEWLDENLPSMVERIVAQEIERVSRGG